MNQHEINENEDRAFARLTLWMAIGFIVFVGLSWMLAPTPASAEPEASNDTLTQPYGGCWEGALYTHTQGAQDCRDLGWTMRRHLIVSPKGVAWTDLPKCKTEDGGRCKWNAQRMGNRRGASFVNVGTTDRAILFFVKRFR